MIAFATVVAESEPFDLFAEPGIQASREPDSELIVISSLSPEARSLNLVLEAAGEIDDLEALVIVDTFTELTDVDLCRKLRKAFEDPDVAIVGAYGSSGFRGTAWWEGEVRGLPAEHSYREFGAGTKPLYPWIDLVGNQGEVDAVNELVVALSPWAVMNLRFDEVLHLRHGLELDLCRQARAAGKKIRVEPIGLHYHGPLSFKTDRRHLQLWQEAHIALADKWCDDPTPGDPDSAYWKQRARRSEAEREASNAFYRPLEWLTDAQRDRLQAEMDAHTGSTGWKATAPLRRLNSVVRDRRRGAGSD